MEAWIRARPSLSCLRAIGRCPRGERATSPGRAHREGSAQPVSTFSRGEIVLSLSDHGAHRARSHIWHILTLWRAGLRPLSRYRPHPAKQRVRRGCVPGSRCNQSKSIQSRTAARTVLVMQSRTAPGCPHGPRGSVSSGCARATIAQAAPRADRAGSCAVRASLSATLRAATSPPRHPARPLRSTQCRPKRSLARLS
jgi:hypothetical protein